MRYSRRLRWFVVAGGALSWSICAGQGLSIANGGQLIGPQDLTPPLAASLQAMGGRLMTADKAQVTLTGTVTDSTGSRSAQITIQAPGLFVYREGQGRAVVFNGVQFQTKSGRPSASDEAILESFLANFPDGVYLQFAYGGGMRRIGSHFRPDNNTSKNYSGPYWTVFAFSPRHRRGINQGEAFQQQIFIAIDERTGLVNDVRDVIKAAPGIEKITQTQFSAWNQQGGQWFPGQIVRFENGNRTLSFQTHQASVGTALPAAAFQP